MENKTVAIYVSADVCEFLTKWVRHEINTKQYISGSASEDGQRNWALLHELKTALADATRESANE